MLFAIAGHTPPILHCFSTCRGSTQNLLSGVQFGVNMCKEFLIGVCVTHQQSNASCVFQDDGQRKLFSFLSNNRQWSARSICDLYKARWQIEVFFKQIKQTLKLTDFLGHSANAVRWQVWTALLVYVILRFLSRMSSWTHSFTRIFAVVRASLWQRMDLLGFLKLLCGTAGGSFRNLARPEQAYFPGF